MAYNQKVCKHTAVLMIQKQAAGCLTYLMVIDSISNIFQVNLMNQCERVFSNSQKQEKTGYTDLPSEEPSESVLQQQQPTKRNARGKVGEGREIKMGIEDLRYVLATYIPVSIIEQVENNDTRGCSYLLFHLPFTLLLCDTLQLHPSPSSTLLRDILLQQVKRIQQIDAQPPRQFAPEEVMGVVASAANFQKVPAGHFLRELGRFVERHAVKLSTFMPYYDAMFRLVLRREAYMGKVGCVADLEELLSTTKAEVRAKYHNFDLQ